MASSNEECSYFSTVSPEDIIKGNNHLAVKLHKLLAMDKRNIVFSPFSVSTALAMLFCGATDEAAAEMKRVLDYDQADVDSDNIAVTFRQLLSALEKTSNSCILFSANSLVAQKDFAIKDEFSSILKDSFKALVMEVDFLNEPERALNQINEWVREKTDNTIPHLLDSLSSSVVLILLNAIYFKGMWLNQFKEESTCIDYFYNQGIEDNGSLVQMMHLKESFPSIEKESFKALQLPYKGEEIAMMILLPHSRDGLEALESDLSPSFVTDLKAEMNIGKVEVTLPKFRMEYSISLKEPFRNLGLDRIFQSGAEFGGISDCSRLVVSDVFHKAILDVNEEGCEATPATAVVANYPASYLDPEFIVDHPFLFVIYNTVCDLILFMGRVDDL